MISAQACNSTGSPCLYVCYPSHIEIYKDMRHLHEMLEGHVNITLHLIQWSVICNEYSWNSCNGNNY